MSRADETEALLDTAETLVELWFDFVYANAPGTGIERKMETQHLPRTMRVWLQHRLVLYFEAHPELALGWLHKDVLELFADEPFALESHAHRILNGTKPVLHGVFGAIEQACVAQTLVKLIDRLYRSQDGVTLQSVMDSPHSSPLRALSVDGLDVGLTFLLVSKLMRWHELALAEAQALSVCAEWISATDVPYSREFFERMSALQADAEKRALYTLSPDRSDYVYDDVIDAYVLRDASAPTVPPAPKRVPLSARPMNDTPPVRRTKAPSKIPSLASDDDEFDMFRVNPARRAARVCRTVQRLDVRKETVRQAQRRMCAKRRRSSLLPYLSNFFRWHVVMRGTGTPYEGGSFRLLFEFSTDYPFKGPVVHFENKVYHPNVDEHGAMCMGLLKSDMWKPSTKTATILSAIYQLLAQPDPDDSLVPAIAEQFRTDRPQFEKTAMEYTQSYAK
ncbi:signal peptidase I [Malassezia brasiliensis]|uniref:Signal peptidase I n=1 Tax=Malassezia brasiliensis TaxID=1821822 RepID=A0AAF0DVD9_9BASI|nr:signal peptidase I [Malassezia brasiliensis]